MNRLLRRLAPITAPACGALCTLVSLALSASGTAETVLFDFSTSGGAGGPGGTWNSFAAPGNVTVNTALVDSTGLPTSVRVSFTGQLNNSGNAGATLTFNNNQPGFEGSPDWATSTTNNAASGDLFFTGNASDSVIHAVTLTLSGLTAGDTFSLDFLGSRNVTNADGFYEFSLDGGVSYSGFMVLNADATPATANNWGSNTTQSQFFDNDIDGYDNHRYMNAAGTLSGSTLQVRVTDISNAAGNFAALNAMRLTTVPEPGAAMLLLTGGALVLGMARRRSA